MPDVPIAAWLETATIRAMALSPADPTPLVLVGNTSVPPPEVWHEVSHRAMPGVPRRQRPDGPAGPGP